MTHNKLQLQLAFLGGALVYGSQLQPALAHANHPHSKTDEPEMMAEPEAANDGALSQPIDETSSDAVAPTEIESSAIKDTAIEEIPVSPESLSVSAAKLTDGFSFGLGESIFGLLIVVPFLLLSLKKIR